MKNTIKQLTFIETVLLTVNLILIVVALIYSWDATCEQLSKNQIESLITTTAKEEGIDPELAIAIATVESNLNPNAVGSLGEVGLFQLRPNHHNVVKGNNKQNVIIAMRYLAHLKTTCSHYGSAFFVCYNYGPNRLLKHPKLFPYYRKVSLVLRNRKYRKSITMIASTNSK